MKYLTKDGREISFCLYIPDITDGLLTKQPRLTDKRYTVIKIIPLVEGLATTQEQNNSLLLLRLCGLLPWEKSP